MPEGLRNEKLYFAIAPSPASYPAFVGACRRERCSRQRSSFPQLPRLIRDRSTTKNEKV